MADEPDNLVLRSPAARRHQLDRIETKQDEIIVRLGVLERDLAGLKVVFAGTQARTRLDRRRDLLPAEMG
jgi:hypothetical protein